MTFFQLLIPGFLFTYFKRGGYTGGYVKESAKRRFYSRKKIEIEKISIFKYQRIMSRDSYGLIDISMDF